MKYRKKPVVIEAEQFTREVDCRGVCLCLLAGESFPHVHTIHKGHPKGAVVQLEIGDWIIPENDGVHFYPCKPDIFEKTYELVKEAKNA